MGDPELFDAVVSDLGFERGAVGHAQPFDGGNVVPEKVRRMAALRLQAARIALGYNERRGKTQAAFYKAMGFGKQAAGHWEKGRALPPSDVLIAIYERFEIGPDWILLGRTGGLPAGFAQAIIDNLSKIKGEDDGGEE